MTQDEWVQQALDARVAQGLPRTVTDPVVLARIWDIIKDAASGTIGTTLEARMDRNAPPKPMPQRDETRDNGVGSVG